MAKCLVVDDVEVTRFSVIEFLSDLGVDVITAKNPKEAMSTLGQNSVDVVLLDWHLGQDSGIDLLKDIRSKHGSKLPIVIFSGVENQGSAPQAINAGANSFLEKPTTQEKLHRCLSGLGIEMKKPH